jgi:signal peptidase I
VERGRGFVWFVVVVVGAGLAARAALFDTWTVPEELGGAAEPTLGGGDVVLVGKRAGGGFGDLVRCETMDEGRPAIGRIVGTPGDNVETEGARLVINGHAYDDTSACPTPRVTVDSPRIGRSVEISCSREEMAGGWHYRGSGGSLFPASKSSRTVPSDRFFLLSDDRDFHDDSRDFGMVKPESCRKIYYRLWGKRGYSDDTRRFTLVR